MTYRIPAQVDGAGSIAGPNSLLLTQAELASDAAGLRTISGTTDTVLPSDNGGVLDCTNGSAVTLAVPSGLGAPFTCSIIQGGAGTVTPTASGTSIVNRQSQTGTAGQYALISLVAVAPDFLVLAGDTA